MWIYVQRTGELFDRDADQPTAVGYSGAGSAKNDPKAQEQPGRGPIPAGDYIIERPQDTEKHGPFALPLTPSANNQMFGRSAFMIHGDSIARPGTASQGCIVLDRKTRELIWSTSRILRVVAERAERNDAGV